MQIISVPSKSRLTDQFLARENAPPIMADRPINSGDEDSIERILSFVVNISQGTLRAHGDAV
jgi:hypothetical protein